MNHHWTSRIDLLFQALISSSVHICPYIPILYIWPSSSPFDQNKCDHLFYGKWLKFLHKSRKCYSIYEIKCLNRVQIRIFVDLFDATNDSQNTTCNTPKCKIAIQNYPQKQTNKLKMSISNCFNWQSRNINGNILVRSINGTKECTQMIFCKWIYVNLQEKMDHKQSQKCNRRAHFWAVKMACVMACYRPTRNCYSFSVLFEILPRLNCDTPIGLQGYTAHLFIAMNVSLKLITHTAKRHRSIWEVNNFQKLLFIVSTFSDQRRMAPGPFPMCVRVFFSFRFYWANFIHS